MKNEFIKKPNTLTEYTQEQINELTKCARDPVYFISNYCYIQNQVEGKVKFKLRPYQIKVIKSLHKNRFNILLQPRQSGKTETTAAFAYWFACFNPDKNVLVASNKQKGAADIMNRIRFMYENTPDFLRPGAPFYNRGSIEFDNGSKIWSESTTETTGRGRSCALFISDELAHVKRNIQDLMWASIFPTLSTGGSCVIMSTPNGDSELFSELWRSACMGTNGFVPLEVKNSEIPGRDQAWEDMMIKKFGELVFRQEFKNEFLSNEALLISSLVLQKLIECQPLYVDKGFAFWKEPDPRKTYIIGVDVAEGVKQDYSTIQIVELETLEQIAEYRSNTVKENHLYEAVKYIMTKLLGYVDRVSGKRPTIYWSFENNSAGAALGALYHNDEKFPDVELINGTESRLGMRTINKSKVEACRYLKKLIEQTKGGLTLHSKMLIFELKNFVATGAGYEAKPGATDDLICAFLIVLRVMKYLSEFEPEVFDKLYKSDGDFYEETTSDYEDPMPFIV